MQFYSLLIATLALAISSVHANPQDSPDDTCLRLCRDDPVECPDNWKSAQIDGDDGDKCWTCCAE